MIKIKIVCSVNGKYRAMVWEWSRSRMVANRQIPELEFEGEMETFEAPVWVGA